MPCSEALCSWGSKAHPEGLSAREVARASCELWQHSEVEVGPLRDLLGRLSLLQLCMSWFAYEKAHRGTSWQSYQAWVHTPLQLALSGMGPELVIQREGLLISKVLCLFLNHKP